MPLKIFRRAQLYFFTNTLLYRRVGKILKKRFEIEIERKNFGIGMLELDIRTFKQKLSFCS